MTSRFDYVVIGAGIAGASIGYWLAPHGRTLVLEREAHPGYHSTGRSAAMLIDSYGPPQARALTRASRGFFCKPPPGFCDSPLLRRRGVLMIGSREQSPLIDQHWQYLRETTQPCFRLNGEEAVRLVPVLRAERVHEGILETDAADIDVNSLHQGFLRGIRRNHGSSVVCNAEIRSIERSYDTWQVDTGEAMYSANVLINAAGAWCDEVAHLAGVAPIGIVAKRRSAFTFAAPRTSESSEWPLVESSDSDWYFKPQAGVMLGSPANADSVEPHDVQPEDVEIAQAIAAIESWTHLEVLRPIHTWAGLRSFVSDDELVGGFDTKVDDFFWVAGQGGYGIQTSPAMGRACAALVRHQIIPSCIIAHGADATALSPARLR